MSVRPYVEKKTALIILKNDHLALFVRHFLRANGTDQTTIVYSTREAQEAMRNYDFDLFFIDYDMEEPTAVEWVRALRLSGGPGSEVPVVIIIPAASKEKVWAARDAGVNEILGLPITSNLLEARLTKMYAHPKPFIRVPTYIGPCRRREVVQIYHGDNRRGGKGRNGEESLLGDDFDTAALVAASAADMSPRAREIKGPARLNTPGKRQD